MNSIYRRHQMAALQKGISKRLPSFSIRTLCIPLLSYLSHIQYARSKAQLRYADSLPNRNRSCFKVYLSTRFSNYDLHGTDYKIRPLPQAKLIEFGYHCLIIMMVLSSSSGHPDRTLRQQQSSVLTKHSELCGIWSCPMCAYFNSCSGADSPSSPVDGPMTPHPA